MTDAAGRLSHMVKQALGRPLPLRLRAWDGSEAGPSTGPVLVIRDRRALHRLAWKPGELGLARAWVAGEIDIEGDLYEGLARISGLVWDRGESETKRPALLRTLTALRDPRNLRLAADVLALAGPALPPAPPREEAVSHRGPLHSLRRDRHAISHHYDVGNDFYSLVLGPSMVYSCAYWEDPSSTLEDAQHAKLDLICRKLGLKPGQRLLDVGCGWGSMVLHAVQHYGVEAVGVTISEEQAALARKRLAEAGCTDRAEIRVQDYREIDDGPFDAISSIGMAEHVGSAQYRAYARILHSLLKPGGRLLNHQIARRPLKNEDAYEIDEFIDRYVFPDGELAPVATTAALLEDAGFEVRDVEALREHYALTLRAWVTNLENHWSEATRLTTPGRARVWRLYMAASALAFEQNNIGVNQILAVRTTTAGNAKMPPTRGQWLYSTTQD
ncbi:class I SAM-dependent methyltransferase [Streptomyces filamentosus]|uniref:Class I SAM-dependent methyltransferase n=2 Tax=Streptomyces filamentosus TaxID=67294 RepID=A0ABY4URM4_STRFL|nr:MULTISPECIES: class I SAM-dependent methyltransferase [Streptomyces]EWS95932.1 cyclopropane-fatty-acyl-phospholipid synthase [Streptomyces filamentosus NRRL 11379]MYR82910.1 methyltransferase domain-containing protein [Streptomyces sp. SID5466]USC45657.1 class I SAM-dependent methyltransferase [Streptomyces filamentosus]